MARLASLRDARSHVVRICGALEILQVAIDAGRVRVRQAVIVIDVALRALHGGMGAGQRESRRGMVKRSLSPRSRVVALLTSLRESRSHVVRVRRGLEIFQVAADTGRVGACQVVITVHVTLRALHGRMSAGQREPCRGMIERSLCPRSRAVALLTSRRETRLNMIRIGGAVEVLDMARSAIGRRADKLAIDVALRAGHADVRTRQRELRKSIVIESRRIPRAGIVASLACCREASLGVRWVVRLIEICHVTAHATRRRAAELSAGVAGVAIQSRVRPSQRKIRRRPRMIKLRTQPVVHGVALVARGGEVEQDVVEPGRLRVDEIALMAGVAGGRQTLELADGRALVAGIAVDSSVGTNQREAIQVLIDLLNRNVPSLHGVALFAVGPHLALVNIGVAVGALRSDIREDRLDVTLRTSHAFVHAAQRILGGVVIEFGDGADRLPAAKRVAVLAGNAQASVRTSRVGRRLRLPARR